MAVELKYNCRLYKGTTVELAADTRVFEDNALIYDVTLNILKIGNGEDDYSSLPEVTITP